MIGWLLHSGGSLSWTVTLMRRVGVVAWGKGFLWACGMADPVLDGGLKLQEFVDNH